MAGSCKHENKQSGFKMLGIYTLAEEMLTSQN